MLNINNLSSQVYMSFQKWNKKELDFMFGLVALSGGVFFDFGLKSVLFDNALCFD